jgi:DNA-binding Xre family transcriptional regulator
MDNIKITSMTFLGKYLTDKSINKAEVSRKTGIGKSRLSNLSIKEDTNLKAEELYLISKAIDADPNDILEKVYGHLKLNK